MPTADQPSIVQAPIADGTLAAFHPAFGRPPIPVPDRGQPAYRLMEKICRQIKDAADNTIIPQESGALEIARALSESLYNRNKAQAVPKIPHEPSHRSDPGTVLVGSLRQFANAIFTVGSQEHRPDTIALQRLHDRLDDFLSGPPVRDIRHSPLHALRLMTARLISYYG